MKPPRGKLERERAGKWSLLLFREIRGVHQGPQDKQMAPQVRCFEEIEIKGHLRSCGQGKGDDQGWHCGGGEGPITLQVRKAKGKAGTWSPEGRGAVTFGYGVWPAHSNTSERGPGDRDPDSSLPLLPDSPPAPPVGQSQPGLEGKGTQ